MKRELIYTKSRYDESLTARDLISVVRDLEKLGIGYGQEIHATVRSTRGGTITGLLTKLVVKG